MNNLNNSQTSVLNSYLTLDSVDNSIDSAQVPTGHYRNILGIMSPFHIHITDAIASAWRALEEHADNGQDPQEIDILSRIIHKLTCVASQIEKIEAIICDPLLERINYNCENPGPLSADVLKIIQTAKEYTLRILDIADRSHKAKEHAMASLWQQLNDSLNSGIALSLEELNNITTNMHKIIPAYCRLRKQEVAAYEYIFKRSAPSKEAAPRSSNGKRKAQQPNTSSSEGVIAANSKHPYFPSPSSCSTTTNPSPLYWITTNAKCQVRSFPTLASTPVLQPTDFLSKN